MLKDNLSPGARVRDRDTEIGRYVMKRVNVFTKYSELERLRTPWQIDWKDVDVNRPLLGKGAFSNVYRIQLLPTAPTTTTTSITTPTGGEDHNHNHSSPTTPTTTILHRDVYALKRLNSVMPAHDKKFKTGASDLALEAKLLECLDHPNIIQLYGVKSGDLEDSINHRDYFLVLDYLTCTLDDRLKRWRKDGASLLSKMNKRGNRKRLVERLEDAALGVARGMEYLHSKNIVFRDLKPDNVGFDVDNNIKIFDLGLARDLSCVSRSGEMLGFTGTPRYMANEIGEGKPYGLPVDVYSFGILLWQICTLKDPFDDMYHICQYHQWIVAEGRRPDLKMIKIDELRDLIGQCWAPCPTDRPRFPDIRARLELIVARHTTPERPASVTNSVSSKGTKDGALSGSFHWGTHSSTNLTEIESSRGSSMFDLSHRGSLLPKGR